MGSTGAARGGGGRAAAGGAGLTKRGRQPAPVTPAPRRAARPAMPAYAPGATSYRISQEEFERATGRRTGRRGRR